MKKPLVLALIPLLFLTACENPPSSSAAPPPSPAPEQTEAPALENAWASALIIDVREGGLVVLLGVKGERMGVVALQEPKSTAVMPMPEEISFASEDLGTELLPGMTVELSGGQNGTRLSSPAQIAPTELMAVSYDSGLISLYREVLEELEARCPELDQGTSRLCVDLHNAANLPYGADGAIAWCAGGWFDREVLSDTLGGLYDKGYLWPVPDLRWEEGVFMEIKTGDVAEDSFTLLCTKQRSREEKLSLTFKCQRVGGLWTWQEE